MPGKLLTVKSIFSLFVRNAWSCVAMSNPSLSYFSFHLLTFGRTRKVIPSPWYKGKGGWGVDGIPHPLEFLKFCSTSKRFCLQWKALVESLLEACDVTKKVGRHLGFFLRIRNEVKTVKINNLLRLTCKITQK